LYLANVKPQNSNIFCQGDKTVKIVAFCYLKQFLIANKSIPQLLTNPLPKVYRYRRGDEAIRNVVRITFVVIGVKKPD